MSLGQAFIEIHADLRPFTRDLDGQVKRITDQFDKQVGGALKKGLTKAGAEAAPDLGETIADSVRDGLDRRLSHKKNPVFVRIAAALGGALDDGLSALPTEVKAGIVLGLIAALPLIGGLLTGAISGAIALGVVGLGVGLASQFEQVQERFTSLGQKIRTTLVASAESFGPELIKGADLIESRVEAWAPKLRRAFEAAAKFIIPLLSGVLDMVEFAVDAIEEMTTQGDLDGFVAELAQGFRTLGGAIAFSLETLVNTGEDGQQALRDLFLLVSGLIVISTSLLALLTRIWGVIRTILEWIPRIVPMIGVMQYFINKMSGGVQVANTQVIESNFDLEGSFNGVIGATNAEEKAARDLTRALGRVSEAMYNNIQVDIDFERSLDRISEALERNGQSLDIQSEKGRQNAETFMAGLKAAEERALNRLKVQGYTTEQAVALYDQEIAQVRELARQAGISDAEFNALFGEIVAVSELRISSEEMGVNGLTDGLSNAERKAWELLSLLRHISRTVISGALGGANIPGFADGTIADRPTLGVFGEAGPEVVIPLTKPARAAQLAQQSGLTAILGGNGTQVLVFIGSEQLEARMVKVVERNNRNQATALTQGPRSF